MSTNVDIQVVQNSTQSRTSSDNFLEGPPSYVPKKIQGKYFDKACMCLAEVLGTAALMFFGCMANVPINGTVFSLAPPITFGLTVMMIIQMFGHVSFALLNPAVTITAIVYDLISIKMGFLLVISQVVGAILGYGLLQFLSPSDLFTTENGICMTLPHQDVSVTQAFFIEFFLTAALITLICGAWDPRNRKNSDALPLRIGFSIIALSLAGGPYTDASMNPVRSLAPALWNWNWTNHWIYWVAPILASIFTSFFYRIIFWRRHPKEEIPHSFSKLEMQTPRVEKTAM